MSLLNQDENQNTTLDKDLINNDKTKAVERWEDIVFKHYTPEEWNNLPESIRNEIENERRIFKEDIKKYRKNFTEIGSGLGKLMSDDILRFSTDMVYKKCQEEPENEEDTDTNTDTESSEDEEFMIKFDRFKRTLIENADSYLNARLYELKHKSIKVYKRYGKKIFIHCFDHIEALTTEEIINASMSQKRFFKLIRSIILKYFQENIIKTKDVIILMEILL